MDEHSHSHHTEDGRGGHDHAPDGGPPPDGIREEPDPTYPVGTTVRLTADHMPGMHGATATISGAFATTTYAITAVPTTGGDPLVGHRWVVHEELDGAGPAPLSVGTKVVVAADHVAGLKGAAATIDGATDETVYQVDLQVGGHSYTRHKWVVESEIAPRD